ncbi:MAG: TerB family tellurite resistance protein [SAR86 cluster bacterium]|nr:TerB family tellurite resistance protein [SAR86 cluster bacterium]
MSFWNSAIGAMIGFTIGGPIGALVGGVIGAKFGKKKGSFSFSNNQKNQVAFFAALFACLAKLAKADGRVSQDEIQAVDRFIKERFKFNPDQRKFAIQIFNRAKDDTNSYEDYAYQLSDLLKANKNALLVFYELLFELAMADGVLHQKEQELLRNTTHIFKIDPEIYENLKSQFVDSKVNPYIVLGVTKSMDFEEIKRVYRRKRKEFHPDTLISKGLPEELIERAKEKFIEIQEAYEAIEKERKQ